MKKPVLRSFALLLALCLAACSPSKPKEFKSETGGFSVNAPATLQETTQTLETQAGKIDLHLFSTEEGATGYFVSYCDYPAEVVEKSDPEKMLDGARDGAVGNANGKLASETRITLAGHPGRKVVIDAKSDLGLESIIRAHLFMVKNRLYQVVVVAPKGKASDREVEQFLDSFKLLGK